MLTELIHIDDATQLSQVVWSCLLMPISRARGSPLAMGREHRKVGGALCEQDDSGDRNAAM